MKRIVILLTILLLFSLPLLAQKTSTHQIRGKTEKIGDFIWYTEQNKFENVIKLANKLDEPILAFFSATWCGPCKLVKSDVFEQKEFKRVADKVLLLSIEQTTQEGAAYSKKTCQARKFFNIQEELINDKQTIFFSASIMDFYYTGCFAF